MGTATKGCASLTKVKNPLPGDAYTDGSYSFSIAVDCPVWQYRQTRIRALPAAPGVAIAEGWQDATLPLMEQVYQASTLDPALGTRTTDGALEEAANEFRRFSNDLPPERKKETLFFDLYSHLLSDSLAASRIVCRGWIRLGGRVGGKTVIENYAGGLPR